jgi:hypothetical protein
VIRYVQKDKKHFLANERKGKGNKMKRIVNMKKCRKCGEKQWSKFSTVTTEFRSNSRLGDWMFSEESIIKEWFQCGNCKTKTFTNPVSVVLVPEYNDFQKEEYGEVTRVKPQHHGDTELIKWNSKDGRPYNSYTLVLDEKGVWVDKHGNRVTCYSINGCGEVRWSLSMSNSVDEYSIVKKFGLIWSPLEQWSSKPYWLEKAEQEEQSKKEQGDK